MHGGLIRVKVRYERADPAQQILQVMHVRQGDLQARRRCTLHGSMFCFSASLCGFCERSWRGCGFSFASNAVAFSSPSHACPQSHANKDFVGKINRIFTTDKSEVMLKVMWYYRPEVCA
jgi:hypothetical protein